MRVDLHNHTPLCNHATGTPYEYVKEAVNKNIDIYGFADHAPMEFDYKYRMSFDKMDEYEEMINSLKDEFKDIKILVGYEVDFTPFVDERVLKRDVDYLIGSVHFLDNWGFDNPEFLKEWQQRDIDDVYKEYFKNVLDMVKSGLFQIVGHLDLIKVFGFRPKSSIIDYVYPVIKEIKKSGMVVEVNSAGLRKDVKEVYPSKEILEIIFDENIDITTSSDAHSIKQVGYRLDEVENTLKSIGFKEVSYFEKKSKIKVDL